MEFGRVPEEELDRIDFKLPPDPLFNKKILKRKRVANPKVYVGCAKWGRVEWLGKIYPAKRKRLLRSVCSSLQQHRAECYSLQDLWATRYSKMGGQSQGKRFLILSKDVPGSYSSRKSEGQRFYTE